MKFHPSGRGIHLKISRSATLRYQRSTNLSSWLKNVRLPCHRTGRTQSHCLGRDGCLRPQDREQVCSSMSSMGTVHSKHGSRSGSCCLCHPGSSAYRSIQVLESQSLWAETQLPLLQLLGFGGLCLGLCCQVLHGFKHLKGPFALPSLHGAWWLWWQRFFFHFLFTSFFTFFCTRPTAMVSAGPSLPLPPVPLDSSAGTTLRPLPWPLDLSAGPPPKSSDISAWWVSFISANMALNSSSVSADLGFFASYLTVPTEQQPAHKALKHDCWIGGDSQPSLFQSRPPRRPSWEHCRLPVET